MILLTDKIIDKKLLARKGEKVIIKKWFGDVAIVQAGEEKFAVHRKLLSE